MRYIKHIGVEAGQPLMDPKYEPFSDCFNFFDITVVAKSFVYKQVSGRFLSTSDF